MKRAIAIGISCVLLAGCAAGDPSSSPMISTPAGTTTTTTATVTTTTEVPTTTTTAIPTDADGYRVLEKAEDGAYYADGVLIVNKTYPLPDGYATDVQPEVMAAFEEMKAAAKEDNIRLIIVGGGGYRTYEKQYNIYNKALKNAGKAYADKWLARPNHSEHQSGYALDLNHANSNFNGTPAALWIAEHAPEFGFIIRYPKGKEDITGFGYESWHVRYVGKPLAQEITESGLCLEEYFNISSRYSY